MATNLFSHNEGYESFQSLFSVIQNNILPAIPGYYQYFVFLAGGLFAVLLVIYNLNRERKGTRRAGMSVLTSQWSGLYFLQLIPNLVKTDTEHFMATAPLLVFLFYFLSLDKRAVPAMILLILIFFYGGNSTDLLGRELSDILFRAGMTGISNLLIIVMSVMVYYRFVRNETVAGQKRIVLSSSPSINTFTTSGGRRSPISSGHSMKQ